MIIFRPKSLFDTDSGFLLRYNEKKPEAPELIDLKVTNKCNAGCDFCYMNSTPEGKHASLEWIMAQLSTFPYPPYQIAVGGGEPTEWPCLLDFTDRCNELNIVTNMAVGPANKIEIAEKASHKMGAIGISYVDTNKFNETLNAISGNKSQIFVHAILRKDYIDKWINMDWDKRIQGVIFLLFKPVGRGEKMNLTPSPNDIKRLVEAYKEKAVQVGFDSCSYNVIKQYVEDISIDNCDGGQYSLFVDAVERKAGVCSFLPTSLTNNLYETWMSLSRIKNCPYAVKKEIQI